MRSLRWRDVSIATRLGIVVGIMATLIVGELLTLRFAMRTLSAARAFVAGEGLWSKSQKDAVISLLRYGSTRDEADWNAYLGYLEVPEGDHLARIELERREPDLDAVRSGLLRGRIEPADLEPMIDLLRRFAHVSYLATAVEAWAKADELMVRFKQTALVYRSAILAEDGPRATQLVAEIKELNEQLTAAEDKFSFALGAGCHWLEQLILTLLCTAVVFVEVIGLGLVTFTTRAFSRDLAAVTQTSQRIGTGDFSARTDPHSADEVGQLARSVNHMGEMLQRSYTELEARVADRTLELAHSRDQLRVILSGITDGVTVSDEQGRYVYVNAVAAQILGFATVEELLAVSEPDLVARLGILNAAGDLPTKEQVDGMLARRLDQGGDETTVCLRPPRGPERWGLVKSTPVYDEHRRARLMVTIFKDITERKRAEDAVKLLDELSQVLGATLDDDQAMLHALPLLVPRLADLVTVELSATDELGLCRAAIGRAGALPELAPLDGRAVLDGAPSVLLADPTDAQLTVLAREPAQLERLRALGPCSIMLVAVRSEGATLGSIAMVSVESRRRFEAADLRVAVEIARRAGTALENTVHFRRAQRAIRQRDEFLSIASHELKTPITSLRLMVEHTRRSLELEGQAPLRVDKLSKTFDVAGRQLGRLTRLVEDLLDVSRIEAGKLSFNFEPGVLSDVVRDVALRFTQQLARVGSGLELAVEPGVAGSFDQLRIEQVIDNLLSNAAKYAGGEPVTLSLRRAGDRVQIAVEDRGPGIEPGARERIFERFERGRAASSAAGLGLGLFIAREIVIGHGGTIRVDSAPGHGARFIAELPLTPREVPPA